MLVVWSGRLSLFVFILIAASSNWVLEEVLLQPREAFARLDSLTLTLVTISFLYALYNILGRWAIFSFSVIALTITFTFVSYQFYQYFGGYISYEHIFMSKDLLAAAKYLPLTPIIILLAYFIFSLVICWFVFTDNIKTHHSLSLWQRWRAPFIYFIAALLVFQAHQQRYNYLNTEAYSSAELTYDYDIESPMMFFIRSLPLLKRYIDKEDYSKIAELRILAQALKNKAPIKLPDKYHFSNFNKLIQPYPGYLHQKNELEPLLFSPKKSDINTAHTNKNNILLIVLESVRAYETGLFEKSNSLTPNLDKIASQAIEMTNFYSNSRTTVQAEQAILCSSLDFASKSPYSVKKGTFNGKCLPKLLAEEGYDTSWYHGYSKGFFNRQQFHPSLGFNKLFAKEDFLLDGYNENLDIGWGVPDPITFKKLFNDMLIKDKISKQPFFTQILTLTNHQPFNWDYTDIEFPAELNKKSDVVYDNYQKGIYYTDHALGQFWHDFTNSPLAKNTIVIITADHGVPFYPEEITNETTKHEILYRVPLLIILPERRHEIINTPLSHLDIAPTILSLLNINKAVSFIGRPFLGKNSTLAARPLFQMNTAYNGFQYNGMKCLPYSSVCEDNSGQCVQFSNMYCSSERKDNFSVYLQSKSFLDYIELAIEAGFPRTAINTHMKNDQDIHSN